MYAFRARHGPADLCFTDRFGGVSASPFDELNLAIEGHDDPASVRSNLHLLLADFAPGAELCDLRAGPRRGRRRGGRRLTGRPA